MDRPTVTVHNTVSLDGRLSGFPVDAGLYYELAAAIPHDAVLSGSGTLLAAAREQGVAMTGEDPPADGPPGGDGPLLVVVDSRGRLTRLAWLRALPFWRDVVVLGSARTPAEHLVRLRRLGVEAILTGDDQVDLAAALRELAVRHGVSAVRVDAGGVLNGHLLRLGLVDELSVVVAPHLAGPDAAPLAAVPSAPGLRLIAVRRLRGDQLHLRYAVTDRTGADPAAGRRTSGGRPGSAPTARPG
jgi:2,5-diamino-6-(ribosylamino)-4(3H)-pyrimidinone 5'-phosphate reductase